MAAGDYYVPRIDLHMHSEFSPCSRDTSVMGIASLAEAKGLRKIAITDHGTVRRPRWLQDYLAEVQKARRNSHIDILTGMEVNIRPDGNLAVEHDILRDLDIVIGAVHSLPIIEVVRKRSVLEEYVAVLSKALDASSFDILAHPTSLLFDKYIPQRLADDLVQKLKQNRTAVEINYHHRDPSIEFLRRCVKAGVMITPSSDAHQLKDIGRYEWYEQRLEQIEEPVVWMPV